jgi:predicted ATPase
MTEGLSPLQRYRRDLESGALLADPAQESVMYQLDDLCSRLLDRAAKQNTFRVRARKLMGRPVVPERGLYIWGGVGRGKTHLVDTFYDSLALERKLRVHFHRFMQRVHSALTLHSGAKNPLEVVAEEIADEAGAALSDYFSSLTGRGAGDPKSVEINQRPVNLLADAPGVAWATFSTLCEEPRSAADYVEMAREYHTVLVEQIPRLDRDKEDAARRFINLVDEFYDRNVKVIVTAAQPPETLYEGSRLRFEFERTVSRLQEMRTQEYLKAEHRP